VAESLKLPPRRWRLAIDPLIEYDDLLWGDRDALFSRADQDRFMATLPAARLTVYEETGHCPNWERPEQVVADIAALVLHR
jgi:non-heme chloroperoxidase